MRTDGDFIKELRDEIRQAQATRASFIKAKLGFLVGIFSVGALSLKSDIKTEVLLYLVPLVVCIYDLYIFSEDFGIKRAGVFIGSSPFAPPEEKLWESQVGPKRDLLRSIGGSISSFISVVAAAYMIITWKIALFPFFLWAVISSVLILSICLYPSFKNNAISQYEKSLFEKRKS